jgi:hypothetical protein
MHFKKVSACFEVLVEFQPLINDIIGVGWKVDPLIVITAGVRGTTHTPSMELLETNLKLPKTTIKHTFKEINTVAIQHAGSIILHKRKIENNQPLPLDQ